LCPQIASIVLLSLLGIFLGIGIFFSYSIDVSLNTTYNIVESNQDQIVAEINDLDSLLEFLNVTNYVSPNTRVALDWVINNNNSTHEYKNYLIYFTNVVEYSLFSFFGIGIVIALLGIISVTSSIKGFILLMSILGLLYLPLLWFTASINMPGSAFIADGCPAIENYIENKVGNSLKPWISYYTSCTGANPLINITTQVDNSIAQAKTDLNFTSPNDTQRINELKLIISKFEDVESILDNLSNCSQISSSYIQAKNEICINTLTNIFFIFLVSSASGLIVFASIWSLIKYFVRIPKKDGYSQLDSPEF